MPRNEATTRSQLVDAKLNVAGRTRSQVTREHPYRTGGAYTSDPQRSRATMNELLRRLVADAA